MKKLLTTTAIALSLAMPATAQTSDQGTGTQSGQQMTQEQQMQAMTIMISSLIGKRLYMPSGQAQGEMQQGDAAQTEESGMTAEEQSEVAEGGVEGEVEELEQETETELAEAGQAIESAADELASEVSEVPENWEMVGDIDDVVITRQGEVRALVVDAGGFLGMGETNRRIEIQNVRFVRDSDDEGEYFVVFAGDRALFEQQGQYDQAQAEQAGEMRATETQQIQTQMAAEGRGLDQQQGEVVDWAGVTTDELLGVRVYGQNDEWVGDLSELVVADDGEIESVIIDVGGFLGIGEKAVEMQLDQVTLRRDSRGFGNEITAYVTATEEELDAMEAYVDNL